MMDPRLLGALIGMVIYAVLFYLSWRRYRV